MQHKVIFAPYSIFLMLKDFKSCLFTQILFVPILSYINLELFSYQNI